MVRNTVRALFALAAAAASLAAPSPVRAEGAAAAGSAPFAPGEQIDLSIDYLHVHTAAARIVVGKPEGAVWPVICQAKTDGIATLLDIREHLVAYWDSEARNSRGSDLTALEVGDRHSDRARFDRENGKALVQVVRKGRAKESSHDVPRDVRDLTSALLELRMRPPAPGAPVEFPVFSGSGTFVLRAELEGDETIATPAGRFDTMRLKVRLGFKDKFKTSRDSHVWLTRDERHIPVRMSADFAVGGVVATLTRYRPGSQVAQR